MPADREWVYMHTEYDRLGRPDSVRVITKPLKAKCSADALEEGKKLWEERLKGCDDADGAKRVNGATGVLSWPSKPRVKLEIPIPIDPY